MTAESRPLDERERARRARVGRFVWSLWVVVMVVAAVFYANKAAEERSAFIRWRHQVHELWSGVNIWDRYVFPNPPIMPITLSPLMALPPVTGAVTWFGIKAAMASIAVLLCTRMASGRYNRPYPAWAIALVLALSARTLLSDLHHGNINILILFLVVTMLEAWRRDRDLLAGILLGLAITLKVTPALFVPYFVYKRSWRTVGATALGLGLFFFVVPSLAMGLKSGPVAGASFNLECLGTWWHRMLSPFVVGDDISPQEMNQSLGGVLTRLLADHPHEQSAHGYGGVRYPVNFMAMKPGHVTLLVKGLSFGLLGLLGLFCRTRTTRRDDRRLLGEFALVVLTMLFASERTWKHHYVTLVLPFTYLVYQGMVLPGVSRARRRVVTGSIALAAFLIYTTSSEVGRLIGGTDGHEFAMAYGMYFWGGVVLYLATAWRVMAEQGLEPEGVVEVAPAPHIRLGGGQEAGVSHVKRDAAAG